MKPVPGRQARRLKQRQENPDRALKMHQARLADTRSYAPCPLTQNTNPDIFIGCSGWFYWDWRGMFYPEMLATNQWFGHYKTCLCNGAVLSNIVLSALYNGKTSYSNKSLTHF